MEDVDHHKYHHDAGCSVVARGGVQSKAGCGGCHPADLEPDEEVGDKAGHVGDNYARLNVLPSREGVHPFLHRHPDLYNVFNNKIL